MDLIGILKLLRIHLVCNFPINLDFELNLLVFSISLII